jgi:bacteriocin-like protein
MMKKLSFNEMENIEGGIMCDEIEDVLYYSGTNGLGQYWVVVLECLAGHIQCDK